MGSTNHPVRHDVTTTDDNVRSLAVVACERRRREWTIDAKLAIVAESYSATTSISEVARRHGLNRNQLFTWRSQFRRGDLSAPAGGSFVPVSVAEDDPPRSVPTMPAKEGQPSAVVEIIIGAATVRVPPSADEATLRRVLAAVRGLA